MTVLAETVQLLASVTRTVMIPLQIFEVTEPVGVLPPLGIPPDQRYVYGVVPPVAITLAVPLQSFLHNGLTEVIFAMVSTVGCVITTLAEDTHPLASITETENVPAQRLVAVVVVWLKGSFHAYEYGPVPPLAVTVAVPLHKPLQVTSV